MRFMEKSSYVFTDTPNYIGFELKLCKDTWGVVPYFIVFIYSKMLDAHTYKQYRRTYALTYNEYRYYTDSLGMPKSVWRLNNSVCTRSYIR